MRRNAVWERILYSRFTRLKSFLHIIHFQESPLHKRCQEVASAPNWFPAPKDWICWPENPFCLNPPSLKEFSQHPNWFPELKDWMGWPENCVSAKIFGKHLVNVNVPANVTGTLDLQWVHCAQGNTRWFESSHSCQCKNMSMPMWHRRNRVSVYATNMTLFWYWTIT